MKMKYFVNNILLGARLNVNKIGQNSKEKSP